VTTGSGCALSRKWKRDRLSRRWLRSRSTPSSSGSSPSTYRDRAPPHPTGSPSPSPYLADHDAGNHVTSGYESETSPTSPRDRDEGCRDGSSRSEGGGGSPAPSDGASSTPGQRRTSPDSGHSDDLAVSSSLGPASPRSVDWPG